MEQTGSTSKKRGGSDKTVRTPENIERLRQAMLRSPRQSAIRHATRLGISDRSIRRILHKDLGYHPYKIQLVQSLNPGDYPQRIGFCEIMLARLEENDNQINNLSKSDEAHFHLSGFVNKQNFRYCMGGGKSSFTSRNTSSCSENDSIWCANSANGIIGPYFFDNEAENSVTTL